jgi:RsiW-degrading membrane proteinase PrsW (M82 family)
VNLREAQKLAKTAGPTAQKFAKHVVPHVVKPARVVWNQVLGVAFLAFGIPALFKAIGFYRTLDTEPQSLVRLVWTAIFALIMLFFGIGSFMRARRISRS